MLNCQRSPVTILRSWMFPTTGFVGTSRTLQFKWNHKTIAVCQHWDRQTWFCEDIIIIKISTIVSCCSYWTRRNATLTTHLFTHSCASFSFCIQSFAIQQIHSFVAAPRTNRAKLFQPTTYLHIPNGRLFHWITIKSNFSIHSCYRHMKKLQN